MNRKITTEEIEIIQVAREGNNIDKLTNKQREVVQAIATRLSAWGDRSNTINWRESERLKSAALRLQPELIKKRASAKTNKTHEFCERVRQVHGLGTKNMQHFELQQ